MTRASHFLDIDSPSQLFYLLKNVASRLAESSDKRSEDFLLLIFGLTHLREWIAPGYDWNEKPVMPEHHFFHEIYNLSEFKILQSLCNRSKHMCSIDQLISSLYRSKQRIVPEQTSVPSDGKLVSHFADDKDIEEVFWKVIKFYDEKWFQKEMKTHAT